MEQFFDNVDLESDVSEWWSANRAERSVGERREMIERLRQLVDTIEDAEHGRPSMSSKQRTKCMMALTDLMFERNLLPRPAPSLAPLIRPAMSQISLWAGVTFSG